MGTNDWHRLSIKIGFTREVQLFTKAFIPYNGYYSSPLDKWQGTFQNENAIVLGAKTARNWFLKKNMDNFNNDTNSGFKMVQTGENVAKEIGATKEESDGFGAFRDNDQRC